MKRLASVCLLLGATSFPAFGLEVWQGDMFVTAASPRCARNGVSVNDFFRAVFRPRGLENNGADTRLSLFGTRSAHRYLFRNRALAGDGQYQGDFISPQAVVASWNGEFSDASVEPPSPTGSTPTVVVKLRLRDFGDFGCTLTLEGSLGNRPNL
jgi:hypothetical protein